jgi:hypothetical protein
MEGHTAGHADAQTCAHEQHGDLISLPASLRHERRVILLFMSISGIPIDN